jgi:L-rhamnonate dehydratase
MKITSIRIYRPQKPNPHFNQSDTIVTVETDSGLLGIGEGGSPDTLEQCAGALIGEDPARIQHHWQTMYRGYFYPAGREKLHAIGALDLALWDLKGKILKRPVYELAGGPARDSQFCYATGNDTDWNIELGFKAVKLACTYGTFDGLEALHKDEELVARTRELIGPNVELMLDCWLAFDVEFAVRLAERLRPYGLKWMEDCLNPNDFAAQDSLRRRLPWMTLATGEHWYGPEPFMHAARNHSADILQPDICWAGGFTACQRIVHVAEAAGLEVMLHAGMNTPYGQHFSFSQPNVRWGEYFVGAAPGVPLKETIVFPGMAVPENGRLVPNDEPGFGLGLTDALLDSLRV